MRIPSWVFGLCAAAFVLGGTGTALAQIDECFNDIDCDATGTECGSEVCQWMDNGDHICMAAGTKPARSDGWCTATTDCKCSNLGATCTGIYCSFTTPEDAPASGGSTGAGGSGTSTGGSSTSMPTSTESTDEGGCSVAPGSSSSGLMAFGLALGAGALAFGLRRKR